ncbi:MAG: hypothetical protein H6642_05645 [Caldilineaceae bacterium]|nr:hypothetical protein [Caldilineaceae bacterium]
MLAIFLNLPLLIQFLLVLLAAAAGAFIRNLFKNWNKDAHVDIKPQEVKLKTDATPLDMVLKARGARRAKRRFWYAVIILAWSVAHYRWPSRVAPIEQSLLIFFAALFRGVSAILVDIADTLTTIIS